MSGGSSAPQAGDSDSGDITLADVCAALGELGVLLHSLHRRVEARPGPRPFQPRRPVRPYRAHRY